MYLKVIFTPIVIWLRARKPREKLRLAEEMSENCLCHSLMNGSVDSGDTSID